MKKFVELLEQHCQWIAIGIGGLFLAWVAYAYLLSSPVQLQTGNETLTPGNVDEYVRRNAADVLQRRIEDTRPPSFTDKATDPLPKWLVMLAGTDNPTVALGNPWGSNPLDVRLQQSPELATNIVKVAKLPIVPPAEVLPQEGLKVARVFAAPRPALPVPGAAPAPAPAPGVIPAGAKDLNYVRGEFRIDTAAIAEEFKNADIPNGLPTSVIAIHVYRQEQLPDGNWAAPAEIPPISNGVKLQSVPSAANAQAIIDFRGWVESPQGQSDLLRPPFYQVVQGEGPWDPPAVLPVVDPEVERQKRMKEARDAAELKARQRLQERQNRQTAPQGAPDESDPGNPGERSRSRRSGRGSREPRGPGYLANDLSRPANLSDLAGLQLAQGAPPRPDFPPVGASPAELEFLGIPMEPGGMYPGAPGVPGAAVNPIPPGQGAPNMGPLPQPSFDPRLTQPILGWFFDDNVVEGRTYRYQVIYSIKSPMYLDNRVADPALAQVFELKSELDENAWSEPRTVETSTRFFLANANWQKNVPGSIRVEVYKWAAGKWQVKPFPVGLGDRIGLKDSGVNYGTESMLVDIRYDDRLGRAYVVLLGSDGKLSEREPIADRNNPERAALQQLIASPVIPGAAPGMPGIPGAPPGFPGGPGTFGEPGAIPPEIMFPNDPPAPR